MKKLLHTMAISPLLVVPAGCGSQPDLPFQFSFEDNGDLDITVAGTTFCLLPSFRNCHTLRVPGNLLPAAFLLVLSTKPITFLNMNAQKHA